jgi:hypothetical protein
VLDIKYILDMHNINIFENCWRRHTETRTGTDWKK